MIGRAFLSACLVPLLASTAGLAAPPACVPHVLGSDGRAPATAIARSGETLFVGAGAALLVLDVSNEAHPAQVAKLEIGQVVRGLALTGTTLVATGLDRLLFIDVSDPAHPALEGEFPIPVTDVVSRVATSGDSLYFTYDFTALHVIDASDPAHPVETGTYAATGPYSVAVLGNRAYLAEASGLEILDVSDPAHIESVGFVDGLLGSVSLSGNGRRLAIDRDCGPAGCSDLRFADLEDPDHPVVHGEYVTDGAVDVVLIGGRAYLTDGEVLDLTDLNHPILLGSLPTSYVEQLTATGSRAYLAQGRDGVRIIAVTDSANFHELGSFPAPAPTTGGFLSGGLAVTVTENAVRVFEVSDPGRPELVANKRIGVEAMHGFVPVGDYAFAGSSGSRIRIWDLSDPLHPLPAGSFGPPFQFGLAVDEDRAYVGETLSGSQRIHIFDVADPSAPMAVGEVPLTLGNLDVAARGRVLAVAGGLSGERGVRLFDVSNPALPIARSYLSFPNVQLVSLGGSLLLAADFTGLLRVYDVHDPAHPALRSGTSLGGRPQAIGFYGSLAVVVVADPSATDGYEYLDTVHFLDLSVPDHPVELATARVPGDAHEVAMGPGRVLVADGNGGMSVLESCAPFADGFESGDTSAWSRSEN